MWHNITPVAFPPDFTKSPQNYTEWRKGVEVEPTLRYGEGIDRLCTRI